MNYKLFKIRNNKKENHRYEVYILNYKKYKYWLVFFYLFCLIIYLLLFNYEVWSLLPEEPKLRSALTELNKIQTAINPEDNIINLSKAPIFPYIKVWGKRDNDLKEYIKNRNIYFDKLNRITDNKIITQILRYKSLDSLIILKTYNKYVPVIDSIVKLKNPKDLGNKKKRELEKELNDSINNCYMNCIFEKFNVAYLLQNFPEDFDFKTNSIATLKNITEQKISKIDSFWQAQPVKIPNMDIPFRLDKNINFFLLFFILIAFYLQLLFLNFTSIESEIEFNIRENEKVPTLYNILNRLKIYIPFSNLVSLIFNIILPNFIIWKILLTFSNNIESWFYFYLGCCYGFLLIIIIINRKIFISYFKKK